MYVPVQLQSATLVLLRHTCALADLMGYDVGLAAGLAVGDPVLRTQQPLSVELGPGILENIFDGIQRPLEKIFNDSGKSPFIPLGVDVPALNRCAEPTFQPGRDV